MVGQNIAESLNLHAGDLVNVMGPTEEDSGDQLNFGVDIRVTGIVETGGKEEDYIYMSMADLETLVGEGELDVVELSVSATADELDRYVSAVENEAEGITPRLVKRVTQSESTVLGKLQVAFFEAFQNGYAHPHRFSPCRKQSFRRNIPPWHP